MIKMLSVRYCSVKRSILITQPGYTGSGSGIGSLQSSSGESGKLTPPGGLLTTAQVLLSQKQENGDGGKENE